MADVIGVGGPFFSTASLKRDLLLFDRIAHPVFAQMPLERALQNDCDYLIQKGLLLNPTELLPQHFTMSGDTAAVWDEVLAFGRIVEEFGRVQGRFGQALMDERSRSDLPGATRQFLEFWEHHRDVMWNPNSVFARFYAILLREIVHRHAVPMVSRHGLALPSTVPVQRAEVVQFILSELPIPSERVSFDEVLGFREEMSSEGLRQSFRVWIDDLATGRLTLPEVSDRLEDLVFKYERALKAGRLSRITMPFGIVIVATAVVVQNWVAAATGVLQIVRGVADVMKSDVTVPGREVAYIIKARDRFKTTES